MPICFRRIFPVPIYQNDISADILCSNSGIIHLTEPDLLQGMPIPLLVFPDFLTDKDSF